MRILQCYRFLVGTKIPFDKWPAIIEEFFRRQNLTHRYFHYYLETYDFSQRYEAVRDGSRCKTCNAPSFVCERCRKEAEDGLRKGTGCERAQREHPFLGPIKVNKTEYSTKQFLDNFQEGSGEIKEKIYAILPKLYRRYGFSTTTLIYRDIDFFSRRVSTPVPESEYPINGYQGSGITLYRSCISRENAIVLVVESRYPGEVHDANLYAEALGELLPGVKRLACTDIVMEEAEQSYYEQLHGLAKPLIKQAKEFFVNRMPPEAGNNEPETKVSTACWLKKMAERYGYTYSGYIYYMYFMEKRLPNGHYISLEFVSDPMGPAADPFVKLCGLGFNHQIWFGGFSPQNPRDASEYFTQLFDTLAEAEQSVFPRILELYPKSPEWFMPTH